MIFNVVVDVDVDVIVTVETSNACVYDSVCVYDYVGLKTGLGYDWRYPASAVESM